MLSCSSGAPSAACGDACLVEPVLEDRGDGGVGQRADLDRAGADRLGAGGIDAAEQAQHAEAGAKALLRMRPAGQHGEDQRLGVGADVARLALEALGRPFGITPVRARHVLGQGAVPRAAVAARMGGDALAAVEHLDGARGGAGVDLLADQRVRHRVEEARRPRRGSRCRRGRDAIRHTRSRLGQWLHRRPLDRLEQLAAARRPGGASRGRSSARRLRRSRRCIRPRRRT